MDEKKRLSRSQKSVDSIVRCMQDHSPQNITRAARKIATPTFLSVFAPIVDGQVCYSFLIFFFSVLFAPIKNALLMLMWVGAFDNLMAELN
ncbi:unnamed protein product [Gongylonema pulchrum]|uniref:G_PROTEIN_RECEP_F1_2 domain-containing protein n=1 Tax=Gongylonema pulchrum TaxID=637853 RepID=A0A183F134_9BILA|nr:unnamed protein product [Gongylonema pulchrum]